jgi:hypothetical protein
VIVPGNPLPNDLHINKENEEKLHEDTKFVDIGRLGLNRKKQKEEIEGLRNIISSYDNSDKRSRKLRLIFAGAAISGPFAIFYDVYSQDYFRMNFIYRGCLLTMSILANMYSKKTPENNRKGTINPDKHDDIVDLTNVDKQEKKYLCPRM